MTGSGIIGVMICGHGSRESETAREFDALVHDIAARLPQFQVQSGVLEFAPPSIHDGLKKLAQRGCAHILVIPGTLFSGGHATRDIPAILREFSAQFPGIQMRYGRVLGADAKLVRAAVARVRDAIAVAGGDIACENTALLLAGRGATDPESSALIDNVMREMLNDLLFEYGATVYAGISEPLLQPALQQIAQRGYQRVVVLPYFLFTGVLVNRIYQQTDAVAADYPRVQFVKAAYLGRHPLLVECFVERIMESLATGIVVHG